MQDSPTAELLQALSKFQAATLAAHKDSQAYNYKYASLTSIIRAIQPAKEEGGLCHVFIQRAVPPTEAGSPGFTEVELRLYHAASGGVLTSQRIVPDWDPANTKNPKHQQTGSAISYAKRYLLADMFGIATDENEGETVVSPEETAKSTKGNGTRNTNTQQKTTATTKAPVKAAPSSINPDDPHVAIKTELQEKLVELQKLDPQAGNEWRKYVKNRWNGNIKCQESSVRVSHLITEEMLIDTSNWISERTKTKQLVTP